MYLQKKIDLRSEQTLFLYIYLHYGRISATDVSQNGCVKNEDKKRKVTVFVVWRHLQGEALSSADEILRYYQYLRPEIIGRVRKLRTYRLDKNFAAASALSCRSLKSAGKEMYFIALNFLVVQNTAPPENVLSATLKSSTH